MQIAGLAGGPLEYQGRSTTARNHDYDFRSSAVADADLEGGCCCFAAYCKIPIGAPDLAGSVWAQLPQEGSWPHQGIPPPPTNNSQPTHSPFPPTCPKCLAYPLLGRWGD